MTTQPRKSRRRRRQSNPPPSVFFPDEVITDILSWLPVKPLMKMKCVSKSWKTLISDPKFIKMHFNRSAARSPHFSLVTYKKPTEKYDYGFVPFPVTDLLENRSIIIPNDPYYRLDDKDCCEVVGSCNGLVCLLGYDKKVMWLRVWNPATRKISNKLGYLFNVNYRSNLWRFVFCYDNSTDTYKVVSLHYLSNKPNVSIFSLADNVWRSIQSFPLVPLQVLSSYRKLYGGVQFSCSVNWLAPKWSPNFDNDHCVIISLDLSTESYTQLMLPPSVENLAPSSNICVLMNSFCFSHDSNKTDFVIWKMTEFGDDKSWTQFLKFSYHNNLRINKRFDPVSLNLKPLHLSENGDTVVFVNCLQDQAILYNLRNDTVQKSRVNHKICWFSIKDYVESLVSAW